VCVPSLEEGRGLSAGFGVAMLGARCVPKLPRLFTAEEESMSAAELGRGTGAGERSSSARCLLSRFN
jgi:hypothetical protein